MRTDRRTLLGTVGAAVAGLAGCLGPSSDDDNGGNGEPEGPQGEIVVQGSLEGSVTVDDVSARFEDANIDENLIVEGTLTNNGDSSVRAEMLLEVEGFQFRDVEESVEVESGGSTEFELLFRDVFADQFSGYTLTVTAEPA